jgi:hypothetical protein
MNAAFGRNQAPQSVRFREESMLPRKDTLPVPNPHQEGQSLLQRSLGIPERNAMLVSFTSRASGTCE